MYSFVVITRRENFVCYVCSSESNMMCLWCGIKVLISLKQNNIIISTTSFKQLVDISSLDYSKSWAIHSLISAYKKYFFHYLKPEIAELGITFRDCQFRLFQIKKNYNILHNIKMLKFQNIFILKIMILSSY